MSLQSTPTHPHQLAWPGRVVPGLLLVAAVTAAAYGLRMVPGVSHLSPMISAIFVGILVANVVRVPAKAGPGIALAGKRLLRVAVALLGLQLTFGQVADLGASGIAGAAVALGVTFLFTVWMGRVLGVSRSLSLLLAGGTSICGASAIAAVNAVAGGDDEDVSYAVACITLFGTAAMFLYPLLMTGFGLDPVDYGLWIGFSVHEVAQVVGAGFQGGAEAGQTAVVAKLARVIMLAPLVVMLAALLARSAGSAARPQMMPVFVLGFIVLTGLNSAGLVPEAIKTPLVAATPVLLTASLAALGLGTSFARLRDRGVRPLLLAALASLFIAALSLLLIKLV